MSLSPQFLDDLRARTTLSALVGRTVKLSKAGREFKGCCPFHSEKTASFTVNDEKGFYHCFGCGAHGDAIRWLTDAQGLSFIDAVKALAADAGMEVPAPSAEAKARQEKAGRLSDVLERAQDWYFRQLEASEKAQAALAARGVELDAIARFGIGYAPAKASVAGCGLPPEQLEAAGLLIANERDGLWRDRFLRRIMLPIHDAGGRLVGFSGRIHGDGEPKYLNSPESAAFAKGDTLFNLHRAAPAARAARRLVVVEGHFDVVALDQVGIAEVVAPMGTAITERQLERAWRVANCPVLLFDGDGPGRKAAVRACERAMALVGPGRALSVALLPEGEDPDSLARSQGREAIEAAIAAAAPMANFLFGALFAAAELRTPEGRSALWARLARLAAAVKDEETRAQYLAAWRGRFDAHFPPAPPGLTHEDMLPDGRVGDVSLLKEVERVRLRRVVETWLQRSGTWAPQDAAKAGKWAWDVGRRVSAGLIDRDEAAAALTGLSWTCEAAKPEDLVRSFDYGEKRGFDLAPMLVTMRCAERQRTDMGNAERWNDRFGEDYLYTTAKGWIGWDGRRYRVLNQEKDVTPAEVLGSVFSMVRAIQDEADFVRATGFPEWEALSQEQLKGLEEDPRKPFGMDRLISVGNRKMRLSAALQAWGRSSESSGRIGAVPNLARRWVSVELTDFDTDPMLLNCLNGTLHFLRADEDGPDRVELRPHRREDRLTKITACDFDPDAPAPLFQKLVKWAQPDRGRRRYLRQWLGYNLTGDMGEQIFHIWYGATAANGKSTVGNACREAIGDYGDAGKIETFLDAGQNKGGDAATPAIVRLPAIRMVTCGEPKAGMPINEPLINGVTGGDPMLARDNFRSFFRFLPVFKLTMWCNELPPIPRGTAGIWRRVKVMPWEQHLEEHERDRDLGHKLRAEYAGVLAWMVRGLVDWMANGFVEPESVQLASEEYKHDSDPLSRFINYCTVPKADGRIQSSKLFEVYEAFSKAAGDTPWKQKGFSDAMKNKGFAKKASNGMHWLGIELVKQVSDFVDLQGNVKTIEEEAPLAQSARPPPEDRVEPPDDPDPWFDS